MQHQLPQPQSARSLEKEDMRVELFTLCEAVRDEGLNRMTMIRTFDALHAPTLPVRPCFDVAIRLRFWPSDGLHHSIVLHIIDPDGRPVLPPIGNQITLGPFRGTYSQSFNVIVHISDWMVKQPGEYGVDLFVDQQLEARLPLLILSASQPA